MERFTELKGFFSELVGVEWWLCQDNASREKV